MIQIIQDLLLITGIITIYTIGTIAIVSLISTIIAMLVVYFSKTNKRGE